MNFLEAHKIVHQFIRVLGNRQLGIMLVPYSGINHSKQEIIDAFLIFFGHMAIFNTRTQKEYEQYNVFTHFITYIISDEEFKDIVKARLIKEEAEKKLLFRMMNKDKVIWADDICKQEMLRMSKCWDEYKNLIKRVDFGECLGEFLTFRNQYLNTPENQREDWDFFMDDYIGLVYSKTSQKTPHDEDYSCFWPFDTMRDRLNHMDDLAPIAKKIYTQYKDYILTSK